MARGKAGWLAVLGACTFCLPGCDAAPSISPRGPGGGDAPAAKEGAGPTVPLIEASGVVVRGGGKVAVVGGDETKDRLWAVDLADTDRRWDLRFPAGTVTLDDVEGLAPWGEDGLFVVCSQSRTRTRVKDKPERNRLALVTLSPDARTVRGVCVFEGLRNHLIEGLTRDAAVALEDPKAVAAQVGAQGGLNVEGLAAWKGRLLVGLRSPTAKGGGAIVISIQGPERLVDGSGAWKRPDLGKPFVLAAAPGEGIRDMAADGDAVLVLLGPQGDHAETPFRIVRWNPETGDLRDVSVPGLKEIAVPEGIAPDGDGGLLVVQDQKPPLPKEVFFRLKLADPQDR